MAEMVLRATGSKLKIISEIHVTSTQAQYDTCLFEFDEAWDGYGVRTAVFYSNPNNIKAMLLDGDNKCYIPWDSFGNSRYLYIGVYGNNGESYLPTQFVEVMYQPGANVDDHLYPPTPGIYEQIVASLSEKASTSAVTALEEQMLQKADSATVTAIQSQVTGLASGSPAGTYADLAALIAADPDHSKIYITLDDGKWCYHNGSAWVAGGVYQATAIADGSVSPAKTSFFDNISYNLFNKADALDGYILSNNPALGLAASATAIFSGLMPVVNGKTYLITQPLRLVGVVYAFGEDVTAPLYNTDTICAVRDTANDYGSWPSASGKITRVNSISSLGFYATKLTILDPNIKYIAWDMHSKTAWTHTSEDYNNLVDAAQAIEGEVEMPYMAYNVNKLQETVMPGYLSKNSSTKDITVVISGAIVNVRTEWDDTQDISTRWEYPRVDLNKGLNMQGIYLMPKTTPSDRIIGSLFKSCIDDVTPLFANDSYIGANHGFHKLDSITAAAHGKAIADIGSVWAIGGNNYILQDVVDINTLVMMGDYTSVQTAPITPLSSSAGTLVHVSGATNTADIVYTAKTLTQMYPNTNNINVKFVLDGKEISGNGEYHGDEFDIVEQYGITDIPSVQTFLKASVGGSTKPDIGDNSIADSVMVSNIFSHGRNGSMTVKTSYSYLKETDTLFHGIVQASGIGSKAYVPGVGTVDGFDMSTVITQGEDTITFSQATWLDADNPPYRYHQFNSDLSAGMALGYNTSFGMAKPDARKTEAEAGNIKGTTKKIYPHLGTDIDATPGDYFEGVAFRVPLHVVDPQATCIYWYWVGQDVYLAFDYHVSVDKMVPLPSYLVGKKIEQLDVHANCTVQSEIVSAGGIKVKIVSDYGYGVLRLYN